jgi:LPXTG-site transpeptidase (sortase) family protein
MPTGTVTFNNGTTVLGTDILNDGTATFTTSTLSSGSHTITVSYEGDNDFFISVSAPLTQVVIPDTVIDTNPPNPDSDLTPTFTFSSNVPTATFTCRMDGGGFAPCASGDTFGPLSGGNHIFEVRAIDTFGNPDPTPASYSWKIDIGMPETQIDSKPPAVTNSVSAAFTFSSPDADVVSFECQLDGAGGFSDCTSPQNVSGLSAGPHTFEVRAVDNAGNRDPSPASYTWIVDLGYPTVISSVPAHDSTVNGRSTQFKVTFSKDVLNVPSSAPNYADSATNPANYLLVDDGLNESFDTTACGPLTVDDVAIPMTIPSYTNGTPAGTGPFTAAFTVNGGIPLPDGKYRLLICGTTTIHDVAGNPLNNGTSDTTIEFTVDHTVAGGGGGRGNGGNNGNKGVNGLLIPLTGFPQGMITSLPVQPAEKAFVATDLWLEIPKLGAKLSIVGVPQTGDGWDVSWLGKDAGWLNGSAYPTWNGNSVLTAHVWDALNRPGPFANLIDLKYGDQIRIHTFGQVYIYEVRESQTVSPTNTAKVFKHEEKSWLTLVTCEDYKGLTQTYSYRRMVRAVLVSVTTEK